MQAKHFLAAAALALGLGAAPAQAAFINGGISFSNGFDSTGTTTSIVSQLTLVDVQNPVQALGCSGTFGSTPCVPGFGAFANDFSVLDNGAVIFVWDAFTFVIDVFHSIVRDGLTCDANNQCVDRLLFLGTGYVTGGGFDDTQILLNWSSQGNCTMGAFPGECGSNVTASWSASITATGVGRFVPEPHGAALIGLGALLAGLARRRGSAR